MQAFEKDNIGFKYILTVVYIFSKYAFAVPSRDKTSKAVEDAFKIIFKNPKSFKLQTDKGKEFVNADLRAFLKNQHVQFFTSNNEETKCTNVERFNCTLKSRMWKYFTAKGTRKWIDVLDDLIDSYNQSVHSITKFAPSAINEKNTSIVFEKLYCYESMREYLKSIHKSSKVNVGDKVRIPHKLGIMDKGYYPLWTDMVYDVERNIKGKVKPLVKISNDNQSLSKRYYREEIQKIKLPNIVLKKL